MLLTSTAVVAAVAVAAVAVAVTVGPVVAAASFVPPLPEVESVPLFRRISRRCRRAALEYTAGFRRDPFEKFIECLKLLESQLCSDSIEGCCLSVIFNGLLSIVQPGMGVTKSEVGGIESGIRFNSLLEISNGRLRITVLSPTVLSDFFKNASPWA